AMPPVAANGYPPVPPEKPAPPKPAPADQAVTPPTAPTTQQITTAPPSPPVPGPQVTTAPPLGVTNPVFQENSPYGALPRIAADGRLPWIVNDARFDHRTRTPRISILLIGLGLDVKTTEDAIVKLPPEVSLAFLPYTPNLDRWTKLARDFGHEVLLSLPLESGDPATQQALGPRMLGAQATDAENLDRLRWVLSRASGYTGLVTWEGESFLANEKASLSVLQEISNRGLLLVDSRMAKPNTVQQLAGPIGLPFAKSRGFIDEPRDAAAIDANLATLEDLAKRNNFAMAMAVAFPISIERLVNWSRTVTQRGFVLAPVTGVTQCTGLCQTRVARHAAAVAALPKP
ncbi:MAG: divergent polysaccharide deacetylase family protein, partial [Rhodospirillales bacterium]